MSLTFVILSDRRERRISFAANETLRYAQGDKCGVGLLPQMREKLVPLGSHAREPAAWEPPLLHILDLLSFLKEGVISVNSCYQQR